MKIPESEIPLFSNHIAPLTVILNDLCQAIPSVTYTFTGIDEYQTSIQKAMQIYWSEMLGRTHGAATLSALRGRKWLQGIGSSHEDPNFFAFSSTLRGFLESVADTATALGNAVLTFAEHHQTIDNALQGIAESLSCCPEIEDQLIHFIYARRLPRGHGFPDVHQAQSVRDYLNTYTLSDSSPAHDLYAELCEITHPSLASIVPFIRSHSNNIIIQEQSDRSLILDLISRNQDAINNLLRDLLNICLVTFNTLNKFPLKEYHVSYLNNIDLSNIPQWGRIKNAFEA